MQEDKLLAEGKNIVNSLAVMLRTALIHSIENVAVKQTIDRLYALLSQFLRDGAVRFELKGEFFYINDERIKYPLEYLLNFDYLVKEFKRKELGTVVFYPSLRKDDLKSFTKAFLAASYTDTPFEAIEASLEQVESIDVHRLKKIKEDKEMDKRRLVKKTYFNAVSFTKGIMTKIRTGEKVSIKKAKRVVESMVDTLLEEEALLIGMTAIKDYDDYTYHHSVNVSILSIAIGEKIGLSRRDLTELGLVALFHDIGKMEIPKEVLNKPTPFTEEEWQIIRRHPYWGALTILKLKGLDETSMKAAMVAFEHHIHYDYSGYPKVRTRTPLDFYSKIVTIADQYDAMTSSRVYQRVPLPPDRALSILMERAGKQVDPVLFKFFVNIVGVYPVGSLVLLDTRELALVYECNMAMPERPRVLIIVNSQGQRVKGPIVDLTEKDPSGRFIRTIVKTLDPNKYRVNLAEYLL